MDLDKRQVQVLMLDLLVKAKQLGLRLKQQKFLINKLMKGLCISPLR